MNAGLGTLLLFLFLMLFGVSGLRGGEADEKPADKKVPILAQYLFDRKVTNWIEGTVVSVGDKQFAMNKTQSFFAARYAKMLSEINEKTANFSPDEASKTASEIRARWYSELAGQREDAISESEVVFLLSQQPGGLHVIDESGLYLREHVSKSGDSRLTAVNPYGSASAWGDIKVGDRIVVGCEVSGENRTALVVIRVASAARLDTPSAKSASRP